MNKEKLLKLTTVDMITIKGAICTQCSNLDRLMSNTSDRQLRYVYKKQLEHNLGLLEKLNEFDQKQIV